MRTTLDTSDIRLLIADRYRHMALLLSTMARGFGIREIHTTVDPDVAVGKMSDGLFNCAMLDERVGDMAANDMARIVRDHRGHHRLSIIKTTASPTSHSIEMAQRAGIDLVLAKPFSAFDLYLRVSVLVCVTQPALRSGMWNPVSSPMETVQTRSALARHVSIAPDRIADDAAILL
ncbi:MAG: hypothetical protein AAF638_06065 [Pseudomonadota bacterium]